MNIKNKVLKNPELMENSDISKLIDYITELEDENIELKHEVDKNKKIVIYNEVISDIYNDINNLLKSNEEVDFKLCLVNIIKYINEINRNYNLNLNKDIS